MEGSFSRRYPGSLIVGSLLLEVVPCISGKGGVESALSVSDYCSECECCVLVFHTLLYLTLFLDAAHATW
jgi:hypothetical protein